jgi:hypothetical protein
LGDKSARKEGRKKREIKMAKKEPERGTNQTELTLVPAAAPNKTEVNQSNTTKNKNPKGTAYWSLPNANRVVA